MDREQARREIRAEWRKIVPDLLSPAKDKANRETSYVCPFCGHGTNGDGLTCNPKSADGNGLKCFGCGWSGDVIDLYMKIGGSDYNQALETLAQNIGVEIESYSLEAQKQPQAPAKEEQKQEQAKTEEKPVEGEIQTGTADYKEYYRKCRQQLKNSPEAKAYLEGRGISLATAETYWIGFDPTADPANAPGAMDGTGKLFPTDRIIIPTNKAHYVGRAIDPTIPKRYRAMNPNTEKGAGKAGIFNAKALYAQDAQEVFVTEGIFNALSYIEAGYTAIATNSASNTDILLKELEDHPTEATLILAFDNDKAGREAAAKMREGLRKLNISFLECGKDVIGTGDETEAKEDANDLFVKDREKFVAAVEKTRAKAMARPDNSAEYLDRYFAEEIQRFKQEIKTGFENLDEYAGGLYAGLYVLAATSSLGKTTFALQLADQIAAGGNDVLFFSMEQSRLEMVSKSIARTSYQLDPVTAVSSLNIRRGCNSEAVKRAIEEYKKSVKDRISIIEGNFNCTIGFIGDYVRRYIKNTGTRPVIFIDYLQILQPEQINGRQQTTKETMDAAVTQLKRISREQDVTIICISSVNRAGYLMPIDFESLKESGGIEYSADVVWGLQLQCLKEDLFLEDKKVKEKRDRIKEAKAERVRGIELVCLKNRYGISNYSCYFDYRPENDYYGCSDCDYDYPVKTGKKSGRRL